MAAWLKSGVCDVFEVSDAAGRIWNLGGAVWGCSLGWVGGGGSLEGFRLRSIVDTVVKLGWQCSDVGNVSSAFFGRTPSYGLSTSPCGARWSVWPGPFLGRPYADALRATRC